MTTLLLFLVKSTVCAGIFWAYYAALLRRKPLHQFNRAYLLAAAVASLVIPAVPIDLFHVGNPIVTTFPLLHISGQARNEAGLAAGGNAGHAFTSGQLLAGAYLLVSLLLIIRPVAGMLKVYRLKASGDSRQVHNYRLIKTQHPDAPFSFMHLLFWPEDMPMETPEGMRVLAHEMAHISQRHTIDKLAMQLILAACWINPFNWLLRKELAMQHEFLADQAAIEDCDTGSFARMLLYAGYGASGNSLINAWRQSPVKRRLEMLVLAQQQVRGRRYRKLAILPLSVLLLGLCAFTARSADEVRAAAPITIFLDAAHGGADAGAHGVSGDLEKDLCLRITQRLTALAETYNIRVIATRTADVFVPLPERIAAMNKSAADLCISVHINKATKAGGFELGVCSSNAAYTQSRMLASAIGNRLKSVPVPVTLTDSRAAIVRQNEHTAVLIEFGDIDNSADRSRLDDDAALTAACRSILAGVVDYKQRP